MKNGVKPLTASGLETTRYFVNKGKPFGKEAWSAAVIDQYLLAGTLMERGRPKKAA